MHTQSNINLKLDITKQLSVSVVRYIFFLQHTCSHTDNLWSVSEGCKILVQQYLCSLSDLNQDHSHEVKAPLPSSFPHLNLIQSDSCSSLDNELFRVTPPAMIQHSDILRMRQLFPPCCIKAVHPVLFTSWIRLKWFINMTFIQHYTLTWVNRLNKDYFHDFFLFWLEKLCTV